MKAKDWDDAADLFAEGAVQAESATETHSKAAREYARKRMDSLAMFATKKSIEARPERITPDAHNNPKI